MDEHPDSINDAGFFNPSASSWIDQPATYHNGASGFAFADGHSEIHRWVASLKQPSAQPVKFNNAIVAPARVGDADMHWLSYRAGRNSERSY